LKYLMIFNVAVGVGASLLQHPREHIKTIHMFNFHVQDNNHFGRLRLDKVSSGIQKTLVGLKTEARCWTPSSRINDREYLGWIQNSLKLETLVVNLDMDTLVVDLDLERLHNPDQPDPQQLYFSAEDSIQATSDLIIACCATVREICLHADPHTLTGASLEPLYAALGKCTKLSKIRLMWYDIAHLGGNKQALSATLGTHLKHLKNLHTMAMDLAHFKDWIQARTEGRTPLKHVELLIDPKYARSAKDLLGLFPGDSNFHGLESLMMYGWEKREDAKDGYIF
ncbi:hypothetical protein T439DRAFT_329277, partial [Meredithblackwellia eburnea MCA 4105]